MCNLDSVLGRRADFVFTWGKGVCVQTITERETMSELHEILDLLRNLTLRLSRVRRSSRKADWAEEHL